MTNEEYHRLMNQHYSQQSDVSDSLKEVGSMIDQLIQDGYLAYNVVIDGVFEKKMLIYEHIDPIEGKKDDFRAICLDRENIHRGNVIKLPDGRQFLSVTREDWNGAYTKYKIREMHNSVSYNGLSRKCAMAKKGEYDEISYVNDQNVFEDKELRAIVLPYNDETKVLKLFDNLTIDNTLYKIVKIDSSTMRDNEDDHGVIQIVLIDTPFGEILCNDKLVLNGVVMSARVKDKILNSEARELLCEHNCVRRGDYIDFEYDRDGARTIVDETYLIVNRPVMGKDYDISLMYLCERTMNLLDDKGSVVNVPLYFEDNRSRIDKTNDGQYARFSDSSFLIMCQQNEATLRLNNKVRRIIINGKVYEVTGIADLKEGIMSIGIELGKIDTNDDNEELGIANYKSQMEEIKGNNPDTTGNIVGSDTLTRGFEDEYYLQGAGSGVEWSISCAYVEISQDGSKCYLKFNNLSDVNKTFLLTAKYGGSTFEKSITTSRL